MDKKNTFHRNRLLAMGVISPVSGDTTLGTMLS